MKRRFAWENYFGLLGLILLIVGCSFGLFMAPPERHMGNVSRILYVHVPTAWIAMVCFMTAAGFAGASLWSGRKRWDSAMVGAIEAGLVFNAMLLVQGSLWARPTWGVWWDWDVRLTLSLVMLLLFAGVLALRSFVDDPARKVTWTAVATIVAAVDVPLVYFCVRWWRSLHQVQSTPETVDSIMVIPMRINAFAMLFLAVWFTTMRARIELQRHEHNEVPEPERITPSGLAVEGGTDSA